MFKSEDFNTLLRPPCILIYSFVTLSTIIAMVTKIPALKIKTYINGDFLTLALCMVPIIPININKIGSINNTIFIFLVPFHLYVYFYSTNIVLYK